MVIGQAFTQAMTSFFHNNQFHDHPNTALLGPGGASGGGSQRKLSCPEKVCFLSVWQAAGWVGGQTWAICSTNSAELGSD